MRVRQNPRLKTKFVDAASSTFSSKSKMDNLPFLLRSVTKEAFSSSALDEEIGCEELIIILFKASSFMVKAS
jgi:hypothetical protein